APCPGAFALDPALDVSQYAHTSWKIREGFTKGIITSMAQTPDGYLWLGTEFGLVRFDGSELPPGSRQGHGEPPPGLLRQSRASQLPLPRDRRQQQRRVERGWRFLRLRDRPGHYQTTWFRATVVVAGVGMLWAAYRTRLRRLAHEFEERLQERIT